MELSLEVALYDEESRATAAEGVLTSDLSTEASARVAEDTSLLARINDEESARVAADGVLQGNIDVETGRIDAILLASDADKDSFAEIVALINSVDTENDQAFAGYVLSNDAALAAETSSRVAGDDELTSDLSNEVSRATAAEGSLGSALSTEVARAESAETSLETELGVVEDNLNYNIKSFIGEFDKKLYEEKVERKSADDLLDGKIADIISNTDITSMDSFSEVSVEIEANFSDLTAAIKYEAERAVSAEGSIETSVDNLSSNVENFILGRTPRMIGFNVPPDGINDVFKAKLENGTEIVFLNGLMLREGADYTKLVGSKGPEFTFNSAPAATDKIDIYGVPLVDKFNGTDGDEQDGRSQTPIDYASQTPQ